VQAPQTGLRVVRNNSWDRVDLRRREDRARGQCATGLLETGGSELAAAMLAFSMVEAFTGELRRAGDLAAVADILKEACRALGCRYFALSHHIDFVAQPARGIRVHNYPDRWVEWFDTRKLGVTDPIHRASHRSTAGFMWRDVPAMIPLTAGDRDVLRRALEHGIGDGFTVPANVPGEALGSCSFASARGDELDRAMIPAAQWIGVFAFEAARRCGRSAPEPGPVIITDRQRECVAWLARGKTDWEISRILGVSPATVVAHVKDARDRYNAPTRTFLTVRTLYDGALSFADILQR
jgi:LuxR family transcriptional regulator, quorum-sensing system regulator CciR